MTENNETEKRKPGFLFNLGKLDAYVNGMFVDICADMKEGDNPECSIRDEKDCLTYHDSRNNTDYDVTFAYTSLSPSEARRLGKELLAYAEEIEEEFVLDWVLTCEGSI